MLCKFVWYVIRVYSNCINGNSLLGGQFCTDIVDIQKNGNNPIGHDRLAIIPRLNFTCNGRITSIRARVEFDDNTNRIEYPFFQIWRPSSTVPLVHNKIGEVHLKDTQVFLDNGNFRVANITLTGINTIEVQSGDVVGYYHPRDARYRVRTIPTDGYVLYEFDGSYESVNLNDLRDNDIRDGRQPLIQFTVGKVYMRILPILSWYWFAKVYI